MTEARSDYNHDLFISYRRQEFSREWVRDTFIPQFKKRLDVELGYQANIFFDEASIKDGQVVRNKVLQALKASACMVSILSRAYFTSVWCVAEWETFEKRADVTGIREGGDSLTLPIQWQDGANYLERINAEGFNPRDFTKYRKTGPGWCKTSAYADYEEDLNSLAERVAEMIESAPLADPAWPIVSPEDVNIPPTQTPRFPHRL